MKKSTIIFLFSILLRLIPIYLFIKSKDIKTDTFAMILYFTISIWGNYLVVLISNKEKED